MIRRLGPVCAALAALSLAAGCATSTPPSPDAVSAPVHAAATAEKPTVILISIDGFRPDYLDRGVTPVLSRWRTEGAWGAMRPSFPSVTFPNHYTLVTGLHPDHHGIVSNTIEDAELGRFTLGTASAVTDGRWWDDGEPIWITAEKAGIRTGTMFWPGSEAEIHGARPSYWTKFDQRMPGDARVDQVLAWLDLPLDQRPRLATLYFDIVDTAGHHHGPDAAQTNEAVASVDASLARLEAGLKARGQWDNTILIVASDHGMAATSPERAIYLDDIVAKDAIRIISAGAYGGFAAVEGREAEVQAALVREHPHMTCWNKADIPARYAYGTHPRVPPIVCAPQVGWLIATRDRPVRSEGGAHGYDNMAPEMAAIFIVHGPGVRRGAVIENLDSVDVQPLLARLLGIQAPRGDGRPEDTLPVMVH